jgi:hypothetical protein
MQARQLGENHGKGKNYSQKGALQESYRQGGQAALGIG